MPATPIQRCRHIHIEGRQCGSPALRNEKLCYHHHAARRPLARRPGDPLGPILPDPEDLPAIQRGLAELLRLVARELIEDKQAKLLLALLTQASANLARMDRARRAERALALAEARFAARRAQTTSPISTEPECPTPQSGCSTFATVSSSLRWDHNHAEALVTDLVHDPELGAIAPGPEPESSLETGPEPVAELERSAPADAGGDPTSDSPQPVSLLQRWDRDRAKAAAPHPTPDSPADRHARERRDQAQAAVEADFQRREQERREERRQLREAAREVAYQNLSPEAQLQEDARRAEEQDRYDNPGPLRVIFPYLP